MKVRAPSLALGSWAQLSSAIEQQIGERPVPYRLYLSRSDYEAVRDAEAARDPAAARRFFRARVGSYVAPLLPRGIAIYEVHCRCRRVCKHLHRKD